MFGSILCQRQAQPKGSDLWNLEHVIRWTQGDCSCFESMFLLGKVWSQVEKIYQQIMIGLNQIRLFYICLHWFLFVVNVHRLLESRIALLFFFLFHYIEAFMSLPVKNTMRAWKTYFRFEGEGRGRINSSVFQWLWASAAYSTNWQRLNRGSLVSSYVKNWTIGCTQ